MRHLILDVVLLGCVGAVCAPVGCSSTSEPPAAASRESAAPPDEPVGEAEEEAQSCTHSTCTDGAALSRSCTSCTNTVCNPVLGATYCCSLVWDDNCVQLANSFCAVQGTQQCSCTHDTCTVGAGLDSGCSACTTRVCDSMPGCCGPNGSWSSTCVALAERFCGVTCAPKCAHNPCDTGVALNPACDPCVETLCAGGFNGDPFCCDSKHGSWDRQCVTEVSACEGCGR